MGNRESGIKNAGNRNENREPSGTLVRPPDSRFPDSPFPNYFAFRFATASCTHVNGRRNNGVSMCPSRRFTQISAV